MRQEELSSFNKELASTMELWQRYVCPNIVDLSQTEKKNCFVTIPEYCSPGEIRLLKMLLKEWELEFTILGWSKYELIIEINL